MQLFGCGPLRKAVVTSSVHSYFTITPWLPADPVYHIIGIFSVGFIRKNLRLTETLTPCISHNTYISSVCSFFKRLYIPPLIPHINCKLQYYRQRGILIFFAYHHCRNFCSVPCADHYAILNAVYTFLFLPAAPQCLLGLQYWCQ